MTQGLGLDFFKVGWLFIREENIVEIEGGTRSLGVETIAYFGFPK